MTNTELTKIREENKLTKTELAKKLGITAMLLGRYESGNLVIPGDVAEKVLALGAAEKAAGEAAKKAPKTLAKKALEEAGKEAAKEAVKKAAGKAVKEVAPKAAEKAAKETAKKVAGKAAKAVAEKTVKDVEKKVAKDAAKAAATVVAVEGAKKAAKKTAAKKTAAKKTAVSEKKAPVVHIESLLGGSITPEEILERLPAGVNHVYVKPEENKAYYTGRKTDGFIVLWE